MRSCIVLGCVCLPAALVAQATSDTITLTDLKTPSSPAFVILGIEPTTVARPSTPRALALELLSRSENGTVVPRDYAVEIAPYWLRRRPTLTFDQYISPSGAQSFRQSFSISFATQARVEGEDSVTAVGLGFRVTPLPGRLSSATRAAIQRLDSLQHARTPLVNSQAELIESIDDKTDSLGSARTRTDSVRLSGEISAKRDSLQQKQLAPAAAAVRESDEERYGFVLQVASALSGGYPSNDFNRGKLQRVGAWGTLSYRWENPHIEFISLARYLRNRADTSQNLLDLGGRLLLIKDRIALSYEAVSRSVSDASVDPGSTSGGVALRFASSTRQTGLVEIRATSDLYITASFGKDFKQGTSLKHHVIAALGLQWHWGDKPILIP
jgi:hypothetical protein